MTLRPHQAATVARGKQLKSLRRSETLLDVVPGGGKSRCVPLLHHHGQLRGGVIWVAPRCSLQEQGAEAAAEGIDGRGAHGLRLAPDLDSYRHEIHDGLVTNFSMLSHRLKDHVQILDEHLGKDSLIVADEVHHCRGKYEDAEDLPAWSRSLDALVHGEGGHRRRNHLMLMTGTPFRGDLAKVYGLDYEANEISAPQHRIRFDRETAIEKNAVTRVRKHWIDGEVSFSVSNGSEAPPDAYHLNLLSGLTTLLENTRSKTRRDKIICAARRAFLSYQSLESVHKPSILNALAHLRQTQRTFPGAQMIVTLDNQGKADYLCDWLRRHHRVRTALAVSSYRNAGAELSEFRNGKYEVLFTVGMAYEGLDAPCVTHLTHLGSYRQPAWLTQFLARAWRWGPSDWPNEGRIAHLFAPCDPQMQFALNQIERMQHSPVADESPPDSSGGGGGDESRDCGRFSRLYSGGDF